jgi:cytidylate kinase
MVLEGSRQPRIAIDGPAGAGKSTVAKELARILGYTYVDTGAMYRAITLKALECGLSPGDQDAIVLLAETSDIRLLNDPSGCARVFLDGRDVTREIRSPQVNAAVSPVSAIAGVRDRMVQIQRLLAAEGGVVMEGRDIGTVVLPEAEVKVYLEASAEERARRRLRELTASGYQATLEEAMEEIRHRDSIDSSRDVAPLTRANDAVVVDSTTLSIELTVDSLVELVRKAGARDV